MVRGGGWVKVAAMIVAGVGALSGATTAMGQVTRVATFENYVEGNSFKPSFTDPLSGITFRDSTESGHGFSIDYATALFGDSTYLTAGGYTPGDGWGLGFAWGFTADLPAAAKKFGLDVAYTPGDVSSPAGMTLIGYDAAGAVVAQATVPGYVPSPFRLEATSSAYDIMRMVVAVPRIGVGYDNVSYTVLPEPAGVMALVGVGVVVAGRRRTSNAER